MSRDKKRPGAHLETLTDGRTGQIGEIRLDKSSMTFYAFGAGLEHSGKDGDALRTWLKVQLRKPTKVEWIPLIEVLYPRPKKVTEYRKVGHKFKDVETLEWDEEKSSYNGRSAPDDSTVDIRVSANRFYVGRPPKGVWRMIAWENFAADDSLEGNYSRAEAFHEPRTITKAGELLIPDHDRDFGWHQGRVLLRFDENLWLGLCAIVNILKSARADLFALLDASDDLKVIQSGGAAIAQKLLSSGATSNEK